MKPATKPSVSEYSPRRRCGPIRRNRSCRCRANGATRVRRSRQAESGRLIGLICRVEDRDEETRRDGEEQKTTDATASLLWKKMRSRWRHTERSGRPWDNVVGGSGGSIGRPARVRSDRSRFRPFNSNTWIDEAEGDVCEEVAEQRQDCNQQVMRAPSARRGSPPRRPSEYPIRHS